MQDERCPETGPVAHLLTFSKPESRTEPGQCVDCGAEYGRITYLRPDGSVVPPDERCEACSDKYHRAEQEKIHVLEATQADLEQRQLWRQQTGLPDMFAGKTLEKFNAKLQPQAFKAISTWEGQSLILASPGLYGVGKTHLVCALAHKIMDTYQAAIRLHGSVVRLPRPVAFTTEQRLLGRIRATFNQNATEMDEQVYMELERVRLLIIDDVGKSAPRDLSFLQSVWYRIIDVRYTSERPVILTTNLSPAELETHIGGACADRLLEMCGKQGIIVMHGESYRGKK